ncbi:MAG: hypothetical protein R2698_13210 [Microthrixaceae bacterium]
MSLWTPDGERPVRRNPPTAGGTSDSSASSTPGATAGPDGVTPELRDALAAAGVEVDQLTPEQLREAAAMVEDMARVRQEMLSVPAVDVIANHLMGIFELGAIHLGQNPPNFAEATAAIEAISGVLERLGHRFGENESVLRQALSQLQLTFVQLKDQVAPAASPTGTAGMDEPVSD